MDALKSSMTTNPVGAAVMVGLVFALITSAAIYINKPKYAMADDSTTSKPKYNKSVVSSVVLLVGVGLGAATFYGIKAMGGPAAATMGFRFAMESCGCGY